MAERQQLVDEGGPARRGLLDLGEVRSERVVLGVLVEQQGGVSHDRGQQVVEVVRDTARQPPDGLHLL